MLENQPIVFVPIFVMIFFDILIGMSLYYEGKWLLLALSQILVCVTVALLLYANRRITSDREG